MQEYLDTNLFWAGDNRLWGLFQHFAFLRHGSKPAIFFFVSMKCICWDAFFELIKNLTTLIPEKFHGFKGTPPIPLLHLNRQPRGQTKITRTLKNRSSWSTATRVKVLRGVSQTSMCCASSNSSGSDAMKYRNYCLYCGLSYQNRLSPSLMFWAHRAMSIRLSCRWQCWVLSQLSV